MLSTALAVCFIASAAKHPAPPPPTAAPKKDDVVVESSSGATIKEPNPMVVNADGTGEVPPLREVAAIVCFKHAMRLLGGDRKHALNLCRGGTGSMERVQCAETLVRYFAGAYEDVTRACSDGGTAQTGQCVVDASRLLQGSWSNAINLCAHGGGMDNFQCAKEGLIALGGFTDEVVELCRNVRPLTTQK